MEIFRIDIRNVQTRKELHETIAAVLPLPDYYGNNLDALFDVLTECGDVRTLIFVSGRQVEEALDKYYSALQAMCRAAEKENPNLKIIFEEAEEHS